jgi:hypothetical protein
MALILALVFALSLFIFVIFAYDISLPSLITIHLLTLGIFVSLLVISEEPTAMDVYKGKTTLKITYKDGVAIDSTVVLKNK